MSEIEELPQKIEILMIGALNIVQTESKSRTAPSNHMVQATIVASADSNHASSSAGLKNLLWLIISRIQEFQIKAYLDLDAKQDFDYTLFDGFENDVKKIYKIMMLIQQVKTTTKNFVAKKKSNIYISIHGL